jgi:hypothetical protein
MIVPIGIARFDTGAIQTKKNRIGKAGPYRLFLKS